MPGYRVDQQAASDRCALCEVALVGAERSKEHVIPNAVGGRLKTSGFICGRCNSSKGEVWDSELAKQLNWFGLALGIERERGSPPAQWFSTVDGQRYKLLPDGSFEPKPSYQEEDVDGHKRFHMVAASLREAKQRLAGVARKYPSFDSQTALAGLKVETSYLDSPMMVEFQVGGELAGRSIVKSALAFASHAGVDHADLRPGLAYLLDHHVPPPYGHAYLSDLVIERRDDVAFHCVSVRGEPSKKRLWAYVEYFGFARFLVLINAHYTGPNIDKTYALDPVTGQSIDVKLCTELDHADLLRVVGGNGIDPVVHRAAMDHVMPIVMRRNDDRALAAAVREGFVHAANTLGIPEGADIPREMAEEFTRLMMEKLSPYISHRVRRAR